MEVNALVNSMSMQVANMESQEKGRANYSEYESLLVEI